jgi:SAM-dependent methyltransferase
MRPGFWLEQEERRLLSAILPNLFGYHLLQVGAPYSEDCLGESRIRYCMVMDSDLPASALPESVQAREHIAGLAEALPFISDSLDVVILPHTLELTAMPHQILREVERVLIPEGHAVFLNFNPWGWWMPWRLLRFTRGHFGCQRFVSHARLTDWLELLGFDVVLTRRYFFRPPLAREKIMQRLHFMERFGARWWPFFSGAYLLVAKKRVATLTPTRQRWRPRRSRLSSAGLAETSLRKSG